MLAVKGLDRSIVIETLRPFAGAAFTQQSREALCYRLAGNLPRFRLGRPVHVWSVQRIEEWVPFQILSVLRERSGGAMGVTVNFKALTGTPAGLRCQRWWSDKLCRYLSYDFGFSKRSAVQRYPYSVPEQLVTMRLYGLVTPEECQDKLGFSEIRVPQSLKKWNSRQMKRRFRIDDGFTCPQGYAPSFPCQLCPIGYTTCPAGTHRLDYVDRVCKACKQLSSFDVDQEVGVCVNCHNLNVLRGGRRG